MKAQPGKGGGSEVQSKGHGEPQRVGEVGRMRLGASTGKDLLGSAGQFRFPDFSHDHKDIRPDLNPDLLNRS